jgi:hypothetical protein
MAQVPAGTTNMVIHLGDGLSEKVNLRVSVLDAHSKKPVPNTETYLNRAKYEGGQVVGAGGTGRTARPGAKPPQALFFGEDLEDYVIWVKAPGYCHAYQRVPQKKGFQDINVFMEPGHQQEFKFLSPNSELLVNAKVKVYTPEGQLIPNHGLFAIQVFQGGTHVGVSTRETGKCRLHVPVRGGYFELIKELDPTPIRIPFGPELAEATEPQTITVSN